MYVVNVLQAVWPRDETELQSTFSCCWRSRQVGKAGWALGMQVTDKKALALVWTFN